MATIKVYPARKRLGRNILDINTSIEFDKTDNLKYFWLVAWRLSRKIIRDYLLFAIQHISAGHHLQQNPLELLRYHLHNHPELEQELGVDSNHVIVDKDIYLMLRHENS